MDFSHLIRGTREFFQGHPGKPRDNGVIVPPLINYPEVKSAVNGNHETSSNLQSHSQVIKSSYPAQSGTHGTLSQYYSEHYSEDLTNQLPTAGQQQIQTSHHVNEFRATNIEAKHHTWVQSTVAYAAHTPRLQYEEQKVWEQNFYSEGCDISSNTRLNQNPPISAVPTTNPRMVPPVACQGYQHYVSLKNSECTIPTVNDSHRGYRAETADCSSHSQNFARPAFVQNFIPKNVYQSHRTVASRGNANLTNFRESGRQPTSGNFYNPSLHLASRSPNQPDNMPAPVSCDCLFNRPCPLHRYSKQQDIPTLSRQSSEWGSKIQNNSTKNNVTREKDEYTSLGYPDERPNIFKSPEMMRLHQNASQQTCQSRELPKTSSNSAFTLSHANVEADASHRLSTNFLPHPQTYLPDLPRVKTEKNLGSQLGGVSVIQQPKNSQALSFGSMEVIKKNEERMSVISYSRKHHVSDITLSNVIFSKNAQNQSLPADVLVSWPKKEPATHGCESLQSTVAVDSTLPLNRVSSIGYTNNRSLERQPNRMTKPPKLKMQSLEKLVNRIPPTNNFLIDSMPSKSDPIVSDEKWEEWQSSFDTEWNAFVKDLTASGNIKRIHRVTQPIPKKIKRREQAHVKPMKGSSHSKLPSITDFSSDEDIPLSLRRKTKEDKCNKLF